jgi:MSHA biogenesis protein MshM
MYYEHFGLREAPYRITPDTDVFFTGGNRGAILEGLVYAIVHGAGIVKVTGEVGSGKTMLCNMLQARLPAHVESVYLANPSIAPDEVLRAIAFELGLEIPAGADRLATLHTLHDYLLERHGEGKRVVAFIEESQSMPLATLEQIRLLSNLETRTEKLLQIVLFGQPELDHNLRRPDMRQLRDRIAHSFRLGPLDRAEVGEYLMFRLRAAGYRGPALFPPAVVKRIAHASGGLTRRVNLIADKALLAAFSENTHTVTPAHVRAALRDCEFGRQSGFASLVSRCASPGLAMGASALLGAGVYGLFQSGVLVTRGPAPAAAMHAPAPGGESLLMSSTLTDALAIGSTQAAMFAPGSSATAGASGAAAPLVADAASARGRESEIVSERLAATYRWLALEEPAVYSIQILGAADHEQLDEHLKSVMKWVEIDRVFVYRTSARGKPSLTVLYGTYPDRAAAQEALAHLPPALRAFQPILRTVQGVRNELRQQPGT